MVIAELKRQRMELQTPEEQEEYRTGCMIKARSAFVKVRDWINEGENDGWRPIPYPQNPAITLWEKQDPNHPKLYLLKAKGLIRSAMDTNELRNRNDDIGTRLARMLCDYNVTTRTDWEQKDLADIRLLQEFSPLKPREPTDPHMAIIWTHIKTPPMIADRDFVSLQFAFGKRSKRHTAYSDWWVVHTHTTHPSRPVREDPVRGHLITGNRIRNTASGAELVTVAYVDPKGWVDPNVAKIYKTKLAERVEFYDDLIFNGKLGLLYPIV